MEGQPKIIPIEEARRQKMLKLKEVALRITERLREIRKELKELKEEPLPRLHQPLIRIARPDLLDLYRQENERHTQEKEAVERATLEARQWIHETFGSLKEEKLTELNAEYLDRIQGEVDRHARFMHELRETIRDHYREDEEP